MNLRSIINQIDDIEHNQPLIKKYIAEGVYNSPEMTKHWQRIDEGFFKGYEKYLAEVALTPDQIQNIFKQAGGNAAAEPAKDPGKLEKIVDKVLPTDQAANLEKSLPEPDAGPVQGFEQKAAQAVQNIQGADNSTKQSLMQWVKTGLKKPGTQQLILAALSGGVGTLLSKAGPLLNLIPGGGPVIAAVTGALIAGTVAVASAKMQGQDWKSAFKGAIKPALMGGAAAVIGNLASTAIGVAADAVSGKGNNEPQQPAMSDADREKYSRSIGKGQTLPDGSVVTSLDGPRVELTRPDGTKMFLDRETAMSMANPGKLAFGQAPGDQGNSVSDQMAKYFSDKKGMHLDDAGIWVPDNPSGNTAAPASGAAPAAGNTDLTPAQSDKWTAMQMQAGSLGAGLTPKGGVTLPNPDGSTPPGAFTAQDQVALNQRMQQQADWANGNNPPPEWIKNNSTGKYEPPKEIGKPLDSGIAPIGANGLPMQPVPMDGPAPTPVDTSQAPKGAAMNPEYLQSVIDGKLSRPMISADQAKAALDWQAQNGGQIRSAPEKLSTTPFDLNKYYRDNPNIRENAVDKQATLREWLKRDQQGLPIYSVQIKPIVIEGIFDFFKGGKKDNTAKAEPTMGASIDSLNQAWKAAGSPTDSEEVAKILQSAGIAPDIVTKIYTDLKIPAPGAAPATAPDANKDGKPDTPTAPDANKDGKPDTPTAPDANKDGKPDTPADASTDATTSSAEPPATPQADQQSKLSVGQINKIIPTLRVRDLKSVQKNVDAVIQKRLEKKQPTTEGKYAGYYSKFLDKEI
jgi:hypothetical protein